MTPVALDISDAQIHKFKPVLDLIDCLDVPVFLQDYF